MKELNSHNELYAGDYIIYKFWADQENPQVFRTEDCKTDMLKLVEDAFFNRLPTVLKLAIWEDVLHQRVVKTITIK